MTEHTLYDDADDPHRPIRVGESGASAEAMRWGQLLTLFMRVMALFWLLQGIMQWHLVLTASRPIFEEIPTSAAVAVMFFAVLDLIAGVGLWLATPWGGVLWLLIASAQIFVTLSLPGFFAGGYWLIALDLVLIGVYFVLTFEAGRDFEAQRMRDKRLRRRFEPALDLRRFEAPRLDLRSLGLPTFDKRTLARIAERARDAARSARARLGGR